MSEVTARKLLAQNLRVMRMTRGWSQEALAEASGLDRSYIGDIERAQRNVGVDSLERLAHAFGISVPELLHEPDPEKFGEEMLPAIRRAVSTMTKQ